MADLMQQARELLAAELAKSGLEAAAYEVESSAHRDDELEAYDLAAIRSIAAALRAAPEGFVMVPAEATEKMVRAALPHHWPYLGDEMREKYRRMPAARPQGVKDAP